MAERKQEKSATPQELSLCIANAPSTVLPDRCIIYQKKGKFGEALHGGSVGRKLVHDVAETKDEVNRHLQILGPEFEFKYHNTYSCYKRVDEMTEEPSDFTTNKPSM